MKTRSLPSALRRARFFSVFLLSCATSAGALAGILRVDADAVGAADGSSWSDAYPDLQHALAAAISGDEIWVAAGVYKPTPGSDRNVSFELKSGVSLYGGFAGTESLRLQRDTDPMANGCVLSGDLAGDDGPNFGNIADNSYNVLDGRGATGAVVDGFKIERGFANGVGDFNERGAGIVFSSNDTATLRNVWFDRNKATFGGALYANASGISMLDCAFTGNEANEGGALYANNGVVFAYGIRAVGNRALSRGGAIRAVRVRMEVVNSVLAGNSSDGRGGAVSASTLTEYQRFTNCNILFNTSQQTGSAFESENAELWVMNCILLGNVAAEGAEIGPTALFAAAGNVVDGDPLFEDVEGPDGVAGTLDDDYRLTRDSPAVDAGANASLREDYFDLDDDSDIAENVPFDAIGNARRVRGIVDAGAFEYPGGEIIHVDASAAASGADGNSWATAYPNLQDAIDEAFGGDEVWVACGVYYPTEGVGRAASFQLKDGARLYGGFSTRLETTRAQRQENPRYGGTILSGDIGIRRDVSDNALHVVTVPEDSECVLDGFVVEGGNADVSDLFSTPRGGGIYIPDAGDPSFRNLWIRENRATGEGGGLYSATGNLRIEDAVFSSNVAGSGGGLYADGSGAGEPTTLRRVTFARNRSAESGGALLLASSHPTTLDELTFFRNATGAFGTFANLRASVLLSNSCFVENESGRQGAGIYNANPGLVVDRAAFLGNRTAWDGGTAVALDDGGDASVYNSIFVGNAGPAAIDARFLELALINCSIVAGPEAGSAVAGVDELSIVNCIVVGAPSGGALIDASEAELTVSSSLIEDEEGFANPLFLRASDPGDGDWKTYADNDYGDLRLGAASPAIDAGDDAANARERDFAGRARKVAAAIDVGAYEGPAARAFADLYPALDPDADLNGDGISNFQAFAHGSSPFSDDAHRAALSIRRQGAGFELEFQRLTDEPDLETYLGSSTDLVAWTYGELDTLAVESLESEPIGERRERVRIGLSAAALESWPFYATEFRYSE